MNYTEANTILVACQRLSAKELPFKAAFALSKNIVALERAVEPLTRKAQEASAKVMAVPEAERGAMITTLNAEINEASLEDCGIELEALFKINPNHFADATVPTEYLTILTRAGLLEE